jgi:hypothetical protein
VPPESLDDLDDDFGWLLEAAESMNEYRPPETVRVPREHGGGSLPGNRPGDDFNRRAGWDDVLPRHGWRAVGRSGDKVYWRRPGKEHGWSATTGYCRTDLRGDLLYVFTTSAPPFESEQAYSKFEAYTYLEHNGNWSQAAQALAAAGWGPQPQTIRPPEPVPLPVSVPPLEEGKPNGNATGGGSPPQGEAKTHRPLSFRRIPASELGRGDVTAQWLWHGYISRNAVTLLSALWKAGKTTLLAHLLRALEGDGDFCGQSVLASRVLYVSEEHESKWAERRDELGLKDHVHFILRPFYQKPNMSQWMVFLNDLQTSCREQPVDLIVFDVVSNLWPVKDENDAVQVQAALMPLHAVAPDSAFLLVHHLRKSDGKEATGSRGSGALPAFADTIMELRRYDAGEQKDRRRVLQGIGRYKETPEEKVIELTQARTAKEGQLTVTVEAARYLALGDKKDVRLAQAAARLKDLMPVTDPGLTYEQIEKCYREEFGTCPTKADLLALLDGPGYTRAGRGVRGDAHRYWRPPSLCVSPAPTQGGNGNGTLDDGPEPN